MEGKEDNNLEETKNKFSPGRCGSVAWSVVLDTKNLRVQFPFSQDSYTDCSFKPWSGHKQEATDKKFLTYVDILIPEGERGWWTSSSIPDSQVNAELCSGLKV